ncbi:aspartate 1-decarboxylase [candidate division WOR-3 bacterium]|nr:aspartate 1-decarboxylase [candidate division WOR-3 bacterium]MCK4528366.1 aspartate 1-decarboxylase [candidate division WOR-3 bacterium]
MFFNVLRSKIHMARVTTKCKEYEGSITIDENLARKANLILNEKVLVADVENGNRFDTYVIYGKDREICINGAAANLVEVGDRVIIMAFGITDKENFTPTIVKVDENNRVKE